MQNQKTGNTIVKTWIKWGLNPSLLTRIRMKASRLPHDHPVLVKQRQKALKMLSKRYKYEIDKK